MNAYLSLYAHFWLAASAGMHTQRSTTMAVNHEALTKHLAGEYITQTQSQNIQQSRAITLSQLIYLSQA